MSNSDRFGSEDFDFLFEASDLSDMACEETDSCSDNADLALEGLKCESFCSLVNDFGSGLDSSVVSFWDKWYGFNQLDLPLPDHGHKEDRDFHLQR